MTNSYFVPISRFLKERTTKYSQKEANKLELKRLKKIDFSGALHISEPKKTRTSMILIKKGDLVISGINVEKGAIAVYEGNENIIATIHYSAYLFDKNLIDIEYFKWFLRSSIFKEIVNSSARGGIKTELKPKHFLALKIPLPSLDIQIAIRKKLDSIKHEIEELKQLDIENSEYLQKLHLIILSKAISGKIVPQDANDEPASQLLRKLSAEKEKILKKSTKKLELTKDIKLPYKVPENWIWCYLGEVGLLQRGKSKHRPRNDPFLFENGEYPLVQTGDVSKAKNQNGLIKTYTSKYNENGLNQSKIWPRGTLCITIAANIAETGFLDFESCFPDSIVAFIPLIDQSIAKYVKIFIDLMRSDIEDFAPSTAQKNINLGILEELLFPLPPLAELKRIVDKVNELMKLYAKLEKTVEENQTNSEILMEIVLKEVFEIETL